MSAGSFYIRTRRSGTWALMRQWEKDGKRYQETVEPAAAAAIGLTPDLSVDEARRRVKTLNRNNRLERVGLLTAAKRALNLKTTDSALFPPELVEAFQAEIERDVELHGTSEHRRIRLFGHFNKIQELSVELKLQSKDYAIQARDIYAYFQRRRYSVNYVQKLISMLNRWGRFVGRSTGVHYEPIPQPRGALKANISKLQRAKGRSVHRESAPLTWPILRSLESKLTPEHYRFMFISFAFGLRPIEVDGIFADKASWKVVTDRTTGVKILEVYQSKLTSIDEQDRWKLIPVIFDEQEQALDYIKLGAKRPRSYHITEASRGAYTLYAGRKGFTDWMLEQGQSLEDISAWLGHKSIERTWRHYKDKNKVHFTVTDRTKKRRKI